MDHFAKSLATKNLTLDRRIAAPAVIASLFGGIISYIAIAQDRLDIARVERDTKLDLIERLSGRAKGNATVTTTDITVPDLPFVAAETETTAAAEVDRLIRAVVMKANGAVLSTQASIERGNDTTTRRIEIQAVIEGQIEAIQRTLFNLEIGAPLIFIDDLALQLVERSSGKNEKAQMPLLQASLTLSAFWRSAP
ncbi:type II secretion system protein GspM [Tardiphaga sp.]|uniref:type II secretion system protein GspM n=1 Tax=Tardiphaga sp. TaxID=1926292 RepID=UPI00352B5B0C